MRALAAFAVAASAVLAVAAPPPAVADDLDIMGCGMAALGADERAKHCTIAIQRYPRLSPEAMATLRYRRAVAYAQLGRRGEALADLNRAVALQPGNYLFVALRGQILAELGRLQQALADANRAVALAPDQPVPYALRGEILERLGRRDRALADYRRALALDANERRAAEGVARLSGAPAGPPGGQPGGQPQSDEPTLTFRILKRASGTVRLAFYSQDRRYAWPGNNRHYVLSQNTETHYAVACRENERICYGAWTVDADGDEDRYWGVGMSNGHACSNCCYACNGIRTEVIPLDP
jgi:tetratricopeptide (TPR) repeat protein